MKLLTLGLLAYILTPYDSEGVISALFAKIEGNYSLKNCYLKTYKPATLKPFGLAWVCSRGCMTTTNCRFFCLRKGKLECDFFSSYVAVRWKGNAVPSGQTAYDACYTSWGDPGDILKTNSSFNSSTTYWANTGHRVLDGFACRAQGEYFVTHYLAGSWMQIDLLTPTHVKKIIVATTYVDHIKTMDVFLSNTTDFKLGDRIARNASEPPEWTTCSIEANDSVSGRYFTMYIEKTSYLGITDVQVVPSP